MKPEHLFGCAGVFACAAGLFAIAAGQPTGRMRDGVDGLAYVCVIVALLFLLGGIGALNKMIKGGPRT
ncbi:MAG TPA: hypothetical protein VFS19_05325 [Planctomycetota bacterium]|nr:hypothetical protein [Planctomycetota bacterium]